MSQGVKGSGDSLKGIPGPFLLFTGVFLPEAFDTDQRAYHLNQAAKLDITVDQIIEKRLY
jgi:hypothetical protein